MQRHPHHERLVEAVQTWYTSSSPEMGYVVERRRFGFYGCNVHVHDGRTNRVLIRDLALQHVGEFLVDVRSYFENRPVQIQVDDRAADAVLGPRLLMAGCSQKHSDTYLAHVGPIPQYRRLPEVTIEPVTSANLSEYVVTKLKAFSNSESEPESAEVRAGVALRQTEMAGEGRFLLARFQGEAAAIIGWYEGQDRFVFLVGTRVPFRGRGIAKSLLHRVLADGRTQGCRSVIISADPDDTPIRFYRAMAFVDEVYWRQLYRFEAPSV